MGLLARLFGAPSAGERRLCETYLALFRAAGMPEAEAEKTVRHIVREAKEGVKRDGMDKLPPNCGDSLLERASSDKGVERMLEKKRKEGVRDSDIRWWWNMPELERRVLAAVDDVIRVATFVKLREEEGLSDAEAAAAINERFPGYGDPEDPSQGTGEDRALPWELKDRVNTYVQKRSQVDADGLRREVENSSTFNALIRREIKAGRL